MKCAVCGRKAVLSDPPLCREHLEKHLLKKARRILGRIAGIDEKRVIVAVSGGKDSAALARILSRIKPDVELLHVNLGIPAYSGRSESAVRKLADALDLQLHTVSVRDYGFTLKDIYARGMEESVCSICGSVKRYLFNRFAWENGFDFIATAHNLDDSIALTFLSVASGNYSSYSIDPVSFPRRELKLVGRIKPFFYVREKELLTYALISGLPFYHGACPYSEGNAQQGAKRMLSQLPFRDFGRNLVRVVRKFPRSEPEIRPCSVCGFPTGSASGVCKFCRISKLFNEKGVKE